MYNRQPVLPIDIQYNLNTNNDAKFEYPFNKEIIQCNVVCHIIVETKSPETKTPSETR